MSWLEPVLTIIALGICFAALNYAVDDWRHDGKDR